ncbi:MAG: ATP-dependent helicase [Chloroflexota bacterium]|nr:ATP-dependent helicase [Chloroflexota bacterium]
MTVLHPSVRDRLARLSPDQRAAATAPRGPTLCVAPAGSGKTTTLVARVAWLVAGGLQPEGICAVTFNRRAADELSERVDAALQPLGLAPGAVRIRTFHALGREMLKGAGVDVTRLVDRSSVLSQLLGPRAPPPLLRAADDGISRLKLDPEGTVAASAMVDLFQRYQAHLRDMRSVDFDDFVCRALRLLREDAALLAKWRRACRTLLVDEVQDLDRSQLEMALLLAGPAADLFLVGDDDQTIYAWRLADVRRVLGLAARLPGLRRHDLVTNRRCPPEVVRRASRLVACNRERFVKRIEAAPNAAGSLRLAPDPGDPLARARRLLGAWADHGEGTHAILARTNAELAPFAAVAIEQGRPYRGAEDGLVLDDVRLDAIVEHVEAAQAESPDVPLLALFGRVVMALPAEDRPCGQTLQAWAAPYRTAAGLGESIATARQRRAELRRDDASLVLATAHGTKGLEFDHVACIGLDEGTFPSARTLAEAAEPARVMEEERRLAYVAWTRARRSLTLVYDPWAPSPFLQEAFDSDEVAA